MNAFDSTITKTVHTVQTNSGNSGFSVRYEPFQIVDAIVYEYTAANEICHLIGRVESNANVIYREIYFYIRCTMLSVDEEKALSPGWFWKDKYSQNNWRETEKGKKTCCLHLHNWN